MTIPFVGCVLLTLIVYYTCLGGGSYGYMKSDHVWRQVGPMPILPALLGSIVFVSAGFYLASQIK